MQREHYELVNGPYRRDLFTYDNHILDGDVFHQALKGFLMIPIAIENHKKPVECLKKEITIKNVVIVGE